MDSNPMATMHQKQQQVMAAISGVAPKQVAALSRAGINGALACEDTLMGLVYASELYWRVVGLIPTKARRVKFQMLDAEDAQIKEIEDLMRVWSKDFAIAQQRADTIGKSSFVVINTFGERGQVTQANRIAPQSVARLELKAIVEWLEKKGDYYLYPPDLMGNRKRIHKSRVLEFTTRKHGSLAQRFHLGMQKYLGALHTALANTISRDTVVVTKRGLSDDVANSDDPEDYIRETLKPIKTSYEQDGILLLDARFDAEILGHNLTQVPEVVEKARQYAIAESGLPEKVLLQTSDNESTQTGEDPDLQAVADMVDELIELSWLEKYTQLLSLLRAGYNKVRLSPHTSYSLSATAMAGVMLDFARATTIMIKDQVLMPSEVRVAFSNGLFTPDIELDPNYKPPKMPLHLKSKSKPKNQDNSLVTPGQRGAQDPKSGDTSSNGSEGVRASDISDDEMRLLLKQMGKSQPRLNTLHKVVERALDDGGSARTRVSDFLKRWDGNINNCKDEDLIRRKP